MIKIAVTGSIASGKSFFLNSLSKKSSIATISADREIAKMYQNETILQNVSNILNISNPTKENIKEVVLKEKWKLLKLESLLHKELNEVFSNFERSCRLKGYKACIFEIPLLFEKRSDKKYDFIINVELPIFLQRRRFIKRNGSLTNFNRFNNLQLHYSKKRTLTKVRRGISILNIKSESFTNNYYIKKLSKGIISQTI